MSSATDVTFSTPLGAIRGRRGDGVLVFQGIRYATAARFAPPERTGPWDGVLDATAPGAQCPQSIGIVEQALGAAALPMDEDCLSLNVWTPACDDGARPVLVWIHGGGFTSGTGAMPWYDGTRLCRRGDVVVVTINYRLGALGFSGTTNCGTRDQIAALEWVRDEIASFGGDPSRVTVFGESAGGSSVVALMGTPAARPLFARGCAMSPSISQLRSAARAEEALDAFLHAAEATSLDELADAPLSRVLDAQIAVLDGSFTTFSPAVDSNLFHGPIADAAAEHPLPLVIGTTRDEMALFLTFDPRLASVDEAAARRNFERELGEGAPAAWAAYRAARPQATPKQLVVALHTDAAFRAPAQRLVEERMRRHPETPTWMYRFDWATPAFGGVLGACHAVDIPFTFDNLDAVGVAQLTGTGADRAVVATAYSDAILAFAREGDPGWPRHRTPRRVVRRFGAQPDLLDDPEPALRQLWAARG
ncbi:MAG: carboxylesterase family protein [Ilumatobacteraceae bacterium]